jgi:Hint module
MSIEYIGNRWTNSYWNGPQNATCSTPPTKTVTSNLPGSCISVASIGANNATFMDALFGAYRQQTCTAPVRPPTGPPVFQNWMIPKGSASGCFAGSEMLVLEDGRSISLSAARVGDRVLAYSSTTGEYVYTPIVVLPHPPNMDEAWFVHIQLQSGIDIKVTRDHLLAVGACVGELAPSMQGKGLVKAHLIRVGTCVLRVELPTATGCDSQPDSVCSSVQDAKTVEDAIIGVDVVRGRGLYSAVTLDGDYIVVNGILASPFEINHRVGHVFYNLHRTVYRWAPSLLDTFGLMTITKAAGDLLRYLYPFLASLSI